MSSFSLRAFSVFIPASSFRWNIMIRSDSNFLFVDTKHLTSRKIVTRVKFPSKTALQIDTKFTLDEYISGLGIPAARSFIFREWSPSDSKKIIKSCFYLELVDSFACGRDWDKATGGDSWFPNDHMARQECGHTASNDGDVGILAKAQRKTNRLEKRIEKKTSVSTNRWNE